jgi:hypothetical protein
LVIGEWEKTMGKYIFFLHSGKNSFLTGLELFSIDAEGFPGGPG